MANARTGLGQPPKGVSVEIHKSRDETTIDNDTGDVTIRKDRAGVVKGFGSGLRDHVMKGRNVSVTVGAQIFTGKLPDHHPEAGKWCVQVNFLSFDDEEAAREFSERVTALVEGYLGAKSVMAN